MDGKRNVLLVEDENSLASLIQLNLEIEGLRVIHVDLGSKAFQVFSESKIDLVILDVMLPEITGFDLCKMMKKLKPEIPILFLTAKATSEDKIRGLSIGADDYIVKPFDLKELLLRVQILLRRYPKVISNELVSFRGYQIDFANYQINDINGYKIDLSVREIQFLKLFFDNKNKVISRNEILTKLWNKNENPSSRTIDNYVLGFRKLFEEDPKSPQYFHSIRGIGYKFSEPNPE